MEWTFAVYKFTYFIEYEKKLRKFSIGSIMERYFHSVKYAFEACVIFMHFDFDTKPIEQLLLEYSQLTKQEYI